MCGWGSIEFSFFFLGEPLFTPALGPRPPATPSRPGDLQSLGFRVLRGEALHPKALAPAVFGFWGSLRAWSWPGSTEANYIIGTSPNL